MRTSPARAPALAAGARRRAYGLVASMAAMLPALWTIPTAEPSITGRATHYAAGLMELVAATRELSLAGYAGGVALNRRGDLRRQVWLDWRDGSTDGPYLVVDCAQRHHFADREASDLVVEVDYQTADARGFAGLAPVPVVVHFQQPHADPKGAQ